MVDTHGAGRGEEGLGFCRRETTGCGRRGCRSPTRGPEAGEGGRQVQQHHTGESGLFPKRKEAAWSAARSHSGCAWGGLEGLAWTQGGLGWCPTWGGSSRGGSRWIGAMFGKHQGDCRWERAKGGAGEDPLVEWVMAPSLRWGAWHPGWERNIVTAQSWK